ncbi:hypothetical protein CCP2SC5_30049 [Azospirillaceae bacterium]
MTLQYSDLLRILQVMDVGVICDESQGRIRCYGPLCASLSDILEACDPTESKPALDDACEIATPGSLSVFFEKALSLKEGLHAAFASEALAPVDGETAEAVLDAVLNGSGQGSVVLHGRRRVRLLRVARPAGGLILLIRPERTTADTNEAKLNLFRTTLEMLSDAVTVVDKDLNIVLWNQNLLSFLNFPPSLVAPGGTLIDLFWYNARRGEYGEGDPEEQVRHRTALARQWKSHAFQRVRPDGRVLEIRGNPIPGGGFVTTYTDITARARAESELRAAKDRVEQALEDLRATQNSLLQAEKMASLGGLVAGVAHEINTPVGIGLTSASTLAVVTEEIRRLYQNDDMSQEEFENYLDMASEAARLMMVNMNRAAELIRSFKQVAVDQTSAERREFELGSYIHEVLLSLKPALKKTPHAVLVECPQALIVDSYPGALSQIITNFVMNALLHAFQGTEVGCLTISVKRMDDDQINLNFTDNGKGIPSEYLSKIFDPFFTTRRSAGGSGLGLHVVYNLVTITLQGKISVESCEGWGTRFSLSFPRVAASMIKDVGGERE